MTGILIDSTQPLRRAMAQLNTLRSSAMTLFATDTRGIMQGTLTDGDIRRALLAGATLDTPVLSVMHRTFSAMHPGDTVDKLRDMRRRGIALVPVLDHDGHLKRVLDLTCQRSMLPVDAVLMAGGKGERLRPLTLDTPKPLLPVGHRTIIDRNIDTLALYGIDNINVTVNYLKDKITHHFDGTGVHCIPEDRYLGTIGALTMVERFENDTILVMNSDLLTDIDYEDFYLHFKRHNAMMSAAAVPYTISVPYGIFDLDGRNIKAVSEKPVYNMYANAGIYLLQRRALDYIPHRQVFNATDLIDTLAQAGQTVIRYPLTGLWIDIGTPEEYHKAQDLVKHLDS